MGRFFRLCKRLGLCEPAWPALRRRLPTFGQVAAVLCLLALAFLSYVAGAAVMHFRLPSSDFFGKAFTGAADWFASRGGAVGPTTPADLALAKVTVDRPAATYDGFTLFTTNSGLEATLLDMRGRVVHSWRMPPGGQPAPQGSNWERCHVFPNGDLLALCCLKAKGPYGTALAKFDKDSNLLWEHPANLHHDFHVGEDGRIYALTHRVAYGPPAALDLPPGPYLDEALLVLSPEGRLLDSIPLLEAFGNSTYRLVLSSRSPLDPSSPVAPPGLSQLGGPSPPPGFSQPGGPFPPPGFPQPGGLFPPQMLRPSSPEVPNDVLHANSVRVLTRALAPKFPLFKPGQVLLSLRSPSALAVLDTQTRSVVWAAKGLWQSQHSAEFLGNGCLLLFDNLGSPKGSRVLEYDPVTQGVRWSYHGGKDTSITTIFRGANQRLPNGNTLIVSSQDCQLLEVTKRLEVVWQWGCSVPRAAQNKTPEVELLNLTGARRYGPAELTFLKGGPHARPR